MRVNSLSFILLAVLAFQVLAAPLSRLISPETKSALLNFGQKIWGGTKYGNNQLFTKYKASLGEGDEATKAAVVELAKHDKTAFGIYKEVNEARLKVIPNAWENGIGSLSKAEQKVFDAFAKGGDNLKVAAAKFVQQTSSDAQKTPASAFRRPTRRSSA